MKIGTTLPEDMSLISNKKTNNKRFKNTRLDDGDDLYF